MKTAADPRFGDGDLEERLARAVLSDTAPPLSMEWLQEHILGWAAADPGFRVQLLRFVDVLPTLRTPAAVSDHVRQYFRDSAPQPVRLASGLASQAVLRPVLTRAVREAVFAMAHRFIAGATPDAALPRLQEIAADGIAFTVDLLGEATLSDREADEYQRRYSELLELLGTQPSRLAPAGDRWQGVPPVNVSVKLSSLCARFEPAAPDYVSGVLRERLRPVLRLARRLGAYIHVDMEQYRYKDLVQRVFADAICEPEFAGWPDVGIVVQAYLKDAEADLDMLRALAERRGVPFTVRLVKGAYWNEERIVASQNSWPLPVYEHKEETDTSYERCIRRLLDAWPHLRPAFGTHNPHSIARALAEARERGLSERDIEFQMLHGMAEGLRDVLKDEGFRVRVYVPIGEVIPGMAYLVRRLLENTANEAWFVRASGMVVGRLRPLQPHPDGAIAARPEPVAAGFVNAPPARLFLPEARREMAAALDGVRRTAGRSYPLLIGEHAVAGRPEDLVRYPADPSFVLGRVARAAKGDVDAAVAVARRAFPAWRDRPFARRAAVLRRAAEIMEKRRFDLAATMVYESGKPWAEADGDVAEAVDCLRYYAEEAEALAPRHLGHVLGEENTYVYEGRGVAAVIAPWNFPLAIITGMSAAALVAGNCAVLKPAEQSPIIAARLAAIYREAGVPPEVVHYLPGPGEEVGRALVEHPDVDIIAFTGSNEVGLSILEAASRVLPGQRNIKRVISELGGKNAIIIDDDADLDEAVAGALVSAFGYAGQKCSACSRLIIVGSAYDQCLERLRHAVDSLVAGPPHDPATFVPPVISAEARDRILRYIDLGRRTARLVAEGACPPGPGYYVPPAVFEDVPPDSDLARDEIFGPVLSVFRAATFEEALALAMDSRFALTGGVYSRNPRHLDLARAAFRVGNLYVNRKTTGAAIGRQPFGGLAMSGGGERAGGPDYLRQFLETRVVAENTMRRGFAPEEDEGSP